jgi:Flp pilus assembly protein TadB
VLQTTVGILAGFGVYFIFTDLFKIPNIKTSKAFYNLSKRQKKKASSLELWLQGFAQFIARHLKLNEYKRLQLISDLQTAGMDIAPEFHIANAIIKAGICGMIAVPAFFVFPLIAPVIVTLAFAMYFRESKSIQSRIKKRRESIENELPRLVFTIQKTLTHSRDVLGILESYRQNAGPILKSELDITVADMRSGNYESALTRLENRVGSAMLSDVVRGLISILRGDDTKTYWSTLSVKFSDYQRQHLKQQAQKVPGKVKRLSMVLLFCFIAVYLVVIITEIMSSLGAMFG